VGARIASTRPLAEALGVARNTIALALKPLVAERVLDVRDRSGFYVAEGPLAHLGRRPPEEPATPGPDWERRLSLRPSLQRNIAKPVDWQSFRYPFLYGQSDPGLFPTADWRECARAALSVMEIRGWAQDLVDGDYAPLIEQLRVNILPRRGVWPGPDEIMLTLGAQHALYLAASLLGGPGRRVAFEDPGYPDARNILAALGAEISPMPVDACGLDPARLPADCQLVYVTPSGQCPTGVALSPARQLDLLARAERDDLIVIEDDYGAELIGDVHLPKALKSHDRSGRVVYIGSLSKILTPGLRLGYVVAPAPLIRELRALRRLMLRHPPTNNQHITSLFISLGYADAQFRRYSQALGQRARVLTKALDARLPGWSVSCASPTSSAWVTAPAHIDTRRLADKAAAAGVLIEPGDIFFADPEGPKNHLRLGFASIAANRIDKGVQLLAEAAAGLA
jgi:GntR family transcriptional regulator/MocR family aminotransferase